MSLLLWPCDAAAHPLPLPPPTPWQRYLAWADGRLVGGGGFTGPPRAGVVEIGYFTLPEVRRRGHGRAIAGALLALAWQADAQLQVCAHTVREPGVDAGDNPSARLLRALGWRCRGAVHHADTGPAWRWQTEPAGWTAPARPHGPAGARPGAAPTMAP